MLPELFKRFSFTAATGLSRLTKTIFLFKKIILVTYLVCFTNKIFIHPFPIASPDDKDYRIKNVAR